MGINDAGESGKNIVILKGIETIDATNIKTGFLGHSYYADRRSVISNIFYIIKKSLRANHRAGLKPVSHIDGKY